MKTKYKLEVLTLEKLKELDFFKGLLSASENDLVKKAIEDGRIAIGYNCSMIPEPLLSVGKLFPICLRAPEVDDAETGTFYLSQFDCPYSRYILQNAIEGNYDFLSGLIFNNACVHIDRVEHTLRITDRLPRKENFLSMVFGMAKKVFPAGQDALTEKLREVAGELNAHFGVDMSDAAVAQAIKDYNKCVKLLKEIADMRLEEYPRITGAEWHTVYAATKCAPKDMLIEPLKKLKAALKKREPDKTDMPRIMVMGSDIDDPAYTELIEAQGCRVVADRYCFGSLPGLELISEEGDPYRALADHYMMNTQCPRMMDESHKRRDYMLDAVKEYRVDGVIYEVMKFCDLWGWEALKMGEYSKENGIPFLKFDREYKFSGEGQMRTRVQAFIERLRNINVDEALKG